jgi:hypothetical protein
MEEWKRTEPDLVIYVPADEGRDETNQHFNVVVTPAGTFVATWTTATREADPDQRVVFSRSTDRGRTWTEPRIIDGARRDDPPGTGMASWQFLVVARGVLPEGGTRICCFYNKNLGVDDARAADTGVLRCKWSDNDGDTWSEETFDYPIEPNAISNPDPSVPPIWIVYQNPGATPEGAVLAGFTRWASNAVDPGIGMLERDSEVCFLRFENILTEPDPSKLVVTTWPKSPHGLRVESPFRPGISVAQEPTAQALSDGRLVCVFRTLTGRIWQSISRDDGRSWDEPRPLLYEPSGNEVLNPCAPCPLYKLSDGRFLLVFYNNDGSGHGGQGPTDAVNVRNPAWITIGQEIEGEKVHPIRFGRPKVFAHTQWITAPGTNRTQVATYCSFVEDRGERLIFYPDRKRYLLAKRVTEDILAG